MKFNKIEAEMQETDLNDFIMDIMQDFCEIKSVMKVLKDSTYNENSEITMADIGHTLEVLIAKMSSTEYALNKYIDIAFR